MDKYIGRLLDNRYEILEIIGTGGMAVVYKARCHRLNRLVAIKILKDDFLEDEDFRRRFHAESQAVAMLSHPNIVSVYDVSTSVSLEADYIVMELIEGISLKQYMEIKGVLNWKETLHFAIQIAKALEHAHSRGIVHRDIKPHNVMVLKNGSVKVADFGIARLMSKGDTLTKEALGSVHYISPEQAKGGRVDNRSDIYSLGVVMYEMMTGRPPYEGDSPVAVAIQHINGGAVLPSTLNPNIPGGMEQIIMKAMAHEIPDRYISATQMLADMDEFRKDPAILFDYNTPPLDEVIKLRREPVSTEPEIKTTADRVQERASGQRRRRQEPVKEVKKPQPQRPKKQETGEERGSRVATVAIIACSLVAVMAIIVFLIMLFNGGVLGSGAKMVDVPQLIGKYEDALPVYPGLTVKVESQVYNSEYEIGRIIDQKPKEGDQVEEGTVIYITVSKGKEPQTILMQNLKDLTQTRAQEILDSHSLDLNVKIQEESHETIIAGNVIRTEPTEGTELSSGQEIILYVSLGKDETVEEKKMPNLVGQNLDMAMNILREYGFPEPEYESVYSYLEAGKVVSQSVEKDTKVPLDTVVKLEVSQGPEPTTEPETTVPETTVPETTVPETTQPPVKKTVIIDIDGKITQEESNVYVKRGEEVVFASVMNPEDTDITIDDQYGTGTVRYVVYVNEKPVLVEKVVFTTDG